DWRLRVGLAVKPLERPAATLFDLDGNRGERHDPAKAGGLPVVAEAGEVVLHAVVPLDQGGGPVQPDGSVGRDQTAAGGGRKGLGEKERQGRRRRRDELVYHEEPPVPS